ncbi:MAG: ribosome maturation factor RimM [Syntrophorhabdaceae bacterium]|nr:ribosome maturation factor RimM [Syntrophorhabdaceae bacterium]
MEEVSGVENRFPGLKLLEVGRVTGPHGARGVIRVRMHSGDAGGVLGLKRVWLSGHDFEREYEVSEARPTPGCVLFSLKGINTPEEASVLAGARVFASRNDLPELPEDEFYWADAAGCLVVDEAGEILGKVTGMAPGPAHDWLVVVRNDGAEAYLPVAAAFVLKVDIPARRIVASPPEGW